jgi:hypothetical protein
MEAAAAVICPRCNTDFFVAMHAREALCPGCDAHIVWRRCLTTGEAFPVLTSWQTWTHPGCRQVHTVALRTATDQLRSNEPQHRAGQEDPPASPSEASPSEATPSDAAPLGATLADATPSGATLGDVTWLEGGVAGRLLLAEGRLYLLPAYGVPVMVASLSDVRSASITQRPSSDGVRRWRRGRQATAGCRLELALTGASAHLDAWMTRDALRAALESHLPLR